MTLNNGESLTIAGGASAGMLNIAGTLTLGSTGNFTDLILAGATGSTITLSGGGTLYALQQPQQPHLQHAGDTLSTTPATRSRARARSASTTAASPSR